MAQRVEIHMGEIAADTFNGAAEINNAMAGVSVEGERATVCAKAVLAAFDEMNRHGESSLIELLLIADMFARQACELYAAAESCTVKDARMRWVLAQCFPCGLLPGLEPEPAEGKAHDC